MQGGFIRSTQHDGVFVLSDRGLDVEATGSYRLLTPVERAVVVARFRADAAVREVMAEFGVLHRSACRLRDGAALMR